MIEIFEAASRRSQSSMAVIASSAWIFPASTSKGTSVCSPSSIAVVPPVKHGRRRHGDLRIRASFADVPDRPPDGESKALDPLPVGVPPAGSGNPNLVVPNKAKLALQRAKEYKNKKNTVGMQFSASDRTASADPPVPESPKPAAESSENFEKNENAIAEAISRGIEFGTNKTSAGSGRQIPQKAGSGKTNMGESEGLRVSSLDFLGFDFSDKIKSRGIPAGLAPTVDLSFGGDSPEVEIIVGDMSKFGPSISTAAEPNSSTSDENSGFYKPKVSTWGVFPRPKDISKTFGGGKTIHPGDVLQKAETKAIKEEYTKKLIAKYQNEIGLNVDPKVKAECEKAIEQGNQLMDAGRLREALPFFEKVMNSLVFKSELHGFAALQWSICQDSLGRSKDARLMYDKLQSHPNVRVSKKAKQFMFGFQAMEMMKIGDSLSSSTTGYETYFDAFLPEKSNAVPTAPEEGNAASASFRQALPYLLLLISPIFIVLVAALRKIF